MYTDYRPPPTGKRKGFGMREETRVLGEDVRAPEPAPMQEVVRVDGVTAPLSRDGRPDPQWIRGRCPECGDDLVSNLYYIGGKGYILVWECWGSLGGDAAATAAGKDRCRYRKVL